jgi:uncharacterized protein YfaS (alpha-2-macroglobulin family)
MHTPAKKHPVSRRYLKVLYTLEWLAVIALLALLSLGATAENLPQVAIQEDTHQPLLRMRGHLLQLEIPAAATDAAWSDGRGGRLIVELLDPRDKVIARKERNGSPPLGEDWKLSLELPPAMTRDDLAWHRLKVRIEPADNGEIHEQLFAVGPLLVRPVIRILGQNELIAGAPATVRVVTLDQTTGEPLPGSARVTLSGGGSPEAEARSVTAETTLDGQGIGDSHLELPADFPSLGKLEIRAQTELGTETIVLPVSIAHPVKIWLTTDKPLYQPGHRVYLRILALNRFSRKPAALRPLTLEIEDGKGNRVFRKHLTTDAYGSASSQFQLADEVNLGSYTLRATLESAPTPPAILELPPIDGPGKRGGKSAKKAKPAPASTTQVIEPAVVEEKRFTVDRYVLPKFKLAVKFTGGKNGEEKTFFTPGEKVGGSISAQYLFGQPVKKGSAKLRFTLGGSGAELGTSDVTLGPDGKGNFTFQLPTSSAQRQLEQGAASVTVQLSVTDSAKHTEMKTEKLLISQYPFLINVLPEGGTLVPHLINRVYLITSDPGGMPLGSSLQYRLREADDKGREIPYTKIASDEAGVAVIEVDGDSATTVWIKAEDKKGNHAETAVNLQRRGDSGGATLQLRTDKTLYQAGATLQISLAAGVPKDPETHLATLPFPTLAYLDFIRQGHSVRTQVVPLTEGAGATRLVLTPELAGTLEVRGFIFAARGAMVSDRRLLFVDPAGTLKIDATSDRDSYRPGNDATVHLKVSGLDGRPKVALLDVQVVDEAVFALSERQPGAEKLFFYLEKELLAPRFSIPGIGADKIIAPPVDEFNEPLEIRALKRERAAQLLMAGAAERPLYSLHEDGSGDPMAAGADHYLELYLAAAKASLQKVLAGLNRHYAETKSSSGNLADDVLAAVAAKKLTEDDLLDPWYNRFSFDGNFSGRDPELSAGFIVPGAHGQLHVPLHLQRLDIAGRRLELQGEIKVNKNALTTSANYSQIAGRLLNEKHWPITNAVIAIRGEAETADYNLRASSTGTFQLDFLPAGSYSVEVTAPGYGSFSGKTEQLNGRDLAFVELIASRGEPEYRVEFASVKRKRAAGESDEITPDNQTVTITKIHGKAVSGSTLDTGTLRGRVTNERGAPLAGAIIKAKGPQGSKASETDGKGNYAISYLSPGMYEVMVTMDQYSTVVQSGVQIMAQRTSQQGFKMDSGSGSTIISVRGTGTHIDTTATTSQTSINLSEAIESFARDRNLTTSFDFAPGVVGNSGVGGGNPSISGASGLESQYLIGGVNITNTGYGGIGAYDNVMGPSGEGTALPKIRNFFPETLFVNPALITDANGEAEVTIPLADSITQWRMTLFGSTLDGDLGSATKKIKVFQDFFIDLDLPVSLTQGDTVNIPVAVYNYRKEKAEVELTIKAEDWFALVEDATVKKITVAPETAGVVYYRVRADRLGANSLMVSARLFNVADETKDAVSRAITVNPDGELHTMVLNGRLDADSKYPGDNTRMETLEFPTDALPDASSLRLKLYPGPVSQLVEGLDSMLAMPTGCFEQTSSSVYPDILVLDYLKRTGKLNEQVKNRAENYIALGAQRLVTFETPGGGFSLYGQAPASRMLSAYGLMEFTDLGKVDELDERIIERTRNWLAGQQQHDGNWLPDGRHASISMGDAHDLELRTTAYVAWALSLSGYEGPALSRAQTYMGNHFNEKEDNYTLAILANYAITRGRDSQWSEKLVGLLKKNAEVHGQIASWTLEGSTPFHAYGEQATIETTALVVQALLRSGREPALANQGLNYLAQRKQANGTWGSTQATLQALRALLLSQPEKPADTAGTLNIKLDGANVNPLSLTAENNEVLQRRELKLPAEGTPASVELQFTGHGSIQYQLTGRYHLPWPVQPSEAKKDAAFTLAVSYDINPVPQTEVVTATAVAGNPRPRTAPQVMLELGIPPGFEPFAEDFEARLAAPDDSHLGHLMKYTLAADRVILYLDGLESKQTFSIQYRLRARQVVRAKTRPAKIYEYYNPENSATAKPQSIAVTDPPTAEVNAKQ